MTWFREHDDTKHTGGSSGFELHAKKTPKRVFLEEMQAAMPLDEWQEHDLSDQLFAKVNAGLRERGLLLKEGTVVEVTRLVKTRLVKR